MVVVCAMAKRRMYINVARRYVKMHSESFYRLAGWLSQGFAGIQNILTTSMNGRLTFCVRWFNA